MGNFIKLLLLNEYDENFDEFKERVNQTFSSDWVYLSTDVSDCRYFYNEPRLIKGSKSATVLSGQGFATVWTRRACFRSSDVETDAKKFNAALVKAKLFYTLNKIEFNCVLQTGSILYETFYNQEEKQIGSTNLPPSGLRSEIVPGSIIETLFLKVCEK